MVKTVDKFQQHHRYCREDECEEDDDHSSSDRVESSGERTTRVKRQILQTGSEAEMVPPIGCSRMHLSRLPSLCVFFAAIAAIATIANGKVGVEEGEGEHVGGDPFSRADPVCASLGDVRFSPPVWPPQFHAQLFQNFSGKLSIVDLYYDYTNGRNLNVIHHQLATSLYDLEWTNGTSFYFDVEKGTCRTMHFPVGVLRPTWLDGATYRGKEVVDGFVTNVWTKIDFITYYADVATGRPVRWTFFNGMDMHVMKYEPGVVLADRFWQAPDFCFGSKGGTADEEGSETDSTMGQVTRSRDDKEMK
ncbi:hypothetical protein CBR_g27755 [Chara braunii]|uniref:Uncharacterized protein n=1 Tax=Chara braunii TaxID=69332 RepID=A0A388L890_CHABU|nr:hypothetical protein CBR_g27755 [Chara braunii]|eukprot:GBG78530.1 hypothetical protein CBR_g27755 [Chara braunii]